MSNSSNQQSLFQRHRSWIIAALVVVATLLIVFTPRYRRSITTVDQQHHWEGPTPQRREIVWQPATAMPVGPSETSPSSVDRIRPQLADHGTTLYYSIRDPEFGLQIVRSRLTSEGWTPPQSVDELNSAGDDVGPVISQDGKVLFLYSDRPGGLGGTDLYAAYLEDGAWSEPVNLGAQVNSVAHEYDPAVAPDGSRLYFASNRSKSVGSTPPAWGTTMRSDANAATFDLYTADFDRKTQQWQAVKPLVALSTEFNEGAPVVSPDGAFLFFASDRPTERREPRNFDLYRCRIAGIDLEPGHSNSLAENLGVGINTTANELEPALGMSGFQLLFSRSAADAPEKYGLYQSTAQEIYHDGQWERRSLSGLAAWIGNLLSKYWLVLVLLLAFALLLWFIRQIARQRIAIPAFLLAALILHFLMATGSFYVYFQQSIAEKFRELFQEEHVVAVEILATPAANVAQQPSFDQVAKLELSQPIETADFAKQSLEAAATQAIELVQPQPLAPARAQLADFSKEMAAAEVVATVLVPDPIAGPQSNDPLQRAAVSQQSDVESITMESTVAVPSQPVMVQQVADVELGQQAVKLLDVPPAMQSIAPAETLRTAQLSVDDSETLARLDVQLEETPAKPLDLNRRPQPTLVDAEQALDSPTASEKIAAKQTSEVQMPETATVQMDRASPVELATLPQAEPQTIARDTRTIAIEAEAIPALTETAAPESADSTMSPLARRPVAPVQTAAEGDSESVVPIDSIVGKASHEIDRPTMTINELARQSTPTTSPLELGSVAQPQSLSARRPLAVSSGSDQSPLQRTLVNSDLAGPKAGPTELQRRSNFDRRYADAQVNLQSLLRRRNLDEATKVQVVEQFGGNDQTLVAIRRSLTWLAQHQHEDGHWGLNDFSRQCKDHEKCKGHGNSNADTGGTGLALLPFLGDGNTHQQGPYQDVVQKGIQWLIHNQKPDGDLFSGGEGNSRMYSHGIATIVLCECYGMSGDVSLRAPAQKAIDFIVAAQDPRSGGWRYQPREAGDTSVVGWQVMALKSGQMAELTVPRHTLQESQRWLESVAGEKGHAGQYAYQGGRYNPAMTAEALLCLQYLDLSRNDDKVMSSADYLQKNLPKQGQETSYYWYYGTQAMFHLQGEHWEQWNDAIHPLLIEAQRSEGPMAGTWDPKDQWEHSGGRIYSTSLRTLMLEVYYRHLPIYQVID